MSQRLRFSLPHPTPPLLQKEDGLLPFTQLGTKVSFISISMRILLKS